ncbi:MAG: prenyltransferase/squalene oxidase repeat-containing protein, partial [Thermoguttaceae bacterium]
MTPFIAKLTLQIASGTAKLDEEYKNSVANFFISMQDQTGEKAGGFRGRKGTGDLYYTGFALRGLALLGKLVDDNTARSVEQFIRNHISDEMQGADTVSLLFGVVLLELVTGRNVFQQQGINTSEWAKEQLFKFRCHDNCFASSTKTPFSSTYHTFLVYSTLEIVAPDVFNNPDILTQVASTILQRQKQDGGFVELEMLKHSGTNPTVAAVGLLSILCNHLAASQVPGNNEFLQKISTSLNSGLEFLASQQTVEGGYRANCRVPIPDLLSTFTVLSVLFDQNRYKMVNIETV